MSTYWKPVALRMGLVLGLLPVAFVLLKDRVRALETQAVGTTLHLLGAHHVQVAPRSFVVFIPHGYGGFLAYLSPSCSALAPGLALLLLGMTLPASTWRRRALALLAGCAVVVVGNQIRIDAIAGVGMVLGRSTLVLFHDWVASAFGFAATLLGFMVEVAILLPGRREAARQAAVVGGVPVRVGPPMAGRL